MVVRKEDLSHDSAGTRLCKVTGGTDTVQKNPNHLKISTVPTAPYLISKQFRCHTEHPFTEPEEAALGRRAAPCGEGGQLRVPPPSSSLDPRLCGSPATVRATVLTPTPSCGLMVCASSCPISCNSLPLGSLQTPPRPPVPHTGAEACLNLSSEWSHPARESWVPGTNRI